MSVLDAIDNELLGESNLFVSLKNSLLKWEPCGPSQSRSILVLSRVMGIALEYLVQNEFSNIDGEYLVSMRCWQSSVET